jgi:uncharacterized RDD family membrane protein YckC
MVEEKYRTFWPRVGAGFIDPWILLPLFIVDHLSKRRAIHDLIAHSVVIRRLSPSEGREVLAA